MPTIEQSTKALGQSKANRLYSPSATGLSSSVANMRSSSMVIGNANRLADDLTNIGKSLIGLSAEKQRLDVRAAKLVGNDHALALLQEKERLDSSPELSALDKQSELTKFHASQVMSTNTFDGDEDMQEAYNSLYVDNAKKTMSTSISTWYNQDHSKNMKIGLQSSYDFIDAGGSDITDEQAQAQFQIYKDMGLVSSHQVSVALASAINKEISSEFQEIGVDFLTSNAMRKEGDVYVVDENALSSYIDSKFKNVNSKDNNAVEAEIAQATGVIRSKAKLVQTATFNSSKKYNKKNAKVNTIKTLTDWNKMIKIAENGTSVEGLTEMVNSPEFASNIEAIKSNPDSSASDISTLNEYVNRTVKASETYNSVNVMFKSIANGYISGKDMSSDTDSNMKTLQSALSMDIANPDGSVTSSSMVRNIIGRKLDTMAKGTEDLSLLSEDAEARGRARQEYSTAVTRILALRDKLHSSIKISTFDGYDSIIESNLSPKDLNQAAQMTIYENIKLGRETGSSFQYSRVNQLKTLQGIIDSKSVTDESKKLVQYNNVASNQRQGNLERQLDTKKVKAISKYMTDVEATEYANTIVSPSTINTTIRKLAYKGVDVLTDSEMEDAIDNNTWRAGRAIESFGRSILPFYKLAQTIPAMDGTTEERVWDAIDNIARKNEISDSNDIVIKSSFVNGHVVYNLESEDGLVLGSYEARDIEKEALELTRYNSKN